MAGVAVVMLVAVVPGIIMVLAISGYVVPFSCISERTIQLYNWYHKSAIYVLGYFFLPDDLAFSFQTPPRGLAATGTRP